MKYVGVKYCPRRLSAIDRPWEGGGGGGAELGEVSQVRIGTSTSAVDLVSAGLGAGSVSGNAAPIGRRRPVGTAPTQARLWFGRPWDFQGPLHGARGARPHVYGG